MILDTLNEFCDGVSLNTGGAGSYNLGNQIDLSEARDIGNGEPMYLVIQVAEDITVASSTGTVQFRLVSDDSDTIATDGSATVHMVSPTFATSTTEIEAGTVLLAQALPMEGEEYERYIGLQQVTGATALNAGAINAFLTHDVANWKAYEAVTG